MTENFDNDFWLMIQYTFPEAPAHQNSLFDVP